MLSITSVAANALFLFGWTACGASDPPRTRVSSSASQVSDIESDGTLRQRIQERVQQTTEEEEQQQKEAAAALTPRSNYAAADDGATASPSKPDFVPESEGDNVLSIVDVDETGVLAVYRVPRDSASCSDETCPVTAVRWSKEGERLWRHRLTPPFLGAGVTVLDVRSDGELLLFSAVCEISDQTANHCNVVYALDARTSALRWRSAPDLSTGHLAFDDERIYTWVSDRRGRAALQAIAKDDGRTLAAAVAPAEPTEIAVDKDGKIRIRLRSGGVERFSYGKNGWSR